MTVVLILVLIDSLCRCWCTNSLSCLKKLFEREVFFKCPPAGGT